MKPAIPSLPAACLALLVTACSPSQNPIQTDESPQKPAASAPAGLRSSWKETASYYSIGDPAIHWKETPPDSAEIIRFGANDVFYSNRQPALNRYLLDTTQTPAALKVFTAGKTDTLRWRYSPIGPDSLDIGFACFEACGKRFVRLPD
ncbi:hypothetical protein V9K67_03235 [Paraflavisolibacter sp. H34]|uniref:hypothetical protein n=1 Tax=Huijunlia imazamoxiresistens TaxID=3127457 RepID=UPI0030170A29